MSRLNKYYSILGLPPNASKDEVKKKYRKLALKYHPDINDSPGAQEKFIIINEAYEIITNNKLPKKPLASSYQRSKTQANDDWAEKVKKARAQYEKNKKHNERMILKYFISLRSGYKWRIMKLSAIVSTIVAICMILDLFLPNHFESDYVNYYSKEKYRSIGEHQISLVVTDNNHELWLENIFYYHYQNNPNITIKNSWIFHNPISVSCKQKTNTFIYPIHFTYYWASIILIPIFIIPLVVMRYKKNNPLFVIMYHFSLVIVNILLVYFLFTCDRWAHILTIGFL